MSVQISKLGASKVGCIGMCYIETLECFWSCIHLSREYLKIQTKTLSCGKTVGNLKDICLLLDTQTLNYWNCIIYGTVTFLVNIDPQVDVERLKMDNTIKSRWLDFCCC